MALEYNARTTCNTTLEYNGSNYMQYISLTCLNTVTFPTFLSLNVRKIRLSVNGIPFGNLWQVHNFHFSPVFLSTSLTLKPPLTKLLTA